MKNKDIIRKKVLELGYTLGCYDTDIDTLSENELKRILYNVDVEYTDIFVTMKNKKYVVEISTVDREKDFNILTKEQYIDRYGDERF